MKRKQPEDPRSWNSLREALGEDPEELGIQPVQSTFAAYFLADATVKSASYKPKVYERYARVPYFRPDGWWQFRVAPWCLVNGAGIPGEKAELDFGEIDSWPVAYHGTSCDKLKPILSDGLRKPGETPLATQAHGALGAGPNGSVYLSPSLWYAAHPTYSPLKRIGEERWAQAVVKLRTRPDSYRVQSGSLGNKHWCNHLRIDPNFEGIHGLEWLFDGSAVERCDLVIVGIMLREVGAQAHAETFGQCPSLTDTEHGPEYQWTAFLRKRLEEGQFTIDDTETDTTVSTSSSSCDPGMVTEDTTSSTSSTDMAGTSDPCTCDCTEDDCSLDHGEGLRDTKRINTHETSTRIASKLEVPGALQAEYRLSLGATAALSSGAWSQDTLEALERKMAAMVNACLVRGQGTRADKAAYYNYDRVLKVIREHACSFSNPLMPADILHWHGLCLSSVHAEAGQFRTCNVKCGDYPRLHAFKLAMAMDEYVEGANAVSSRSDLSGSAKAAWCFYHLCRIHPFRDGNGRISRLMAIWSLARHGLPWVFCLVPLFTHDKNSVTSRDAYISAIKRAQAGFGRCGADTRPLAGHIAACLLASLRACGDLPPGYRYDMGNLDLSARSCVPLFDDDSEDTETA